MPRRELLEREPPIGSTIPVLAVPLVERFELRDARRARESLKKREAPRDTAFQIIEHRAPFAPSGERDGVRKLARQNELSIVRRARARANELLDEPDDPPRASARALHRPLDRTTWRRLDRERIRDQGRDVLARERIEGLDRDLGAIETEAFEDGVRLLGRDDHRDPPRAIARLGRMPREIREERRKRRAIGIVDEDESAAFEIREQGDDVKAPGGIVPAAARALELAERERIPGRAEGDDAPAAHGRARANDLEESGAAASRWAEDQGDAEREIAILGRELPNEPFASAKRERHTDRGARRSPALRPSSEEGRC